MDPPFMGAELFPHRGDDDPEHVERRRALARVGVESRCRGDHEIQAGHDEDALSAEAHRRNPRHLLPARQGAAEPPEPAVKEQAAEIAEGLKARYDRLLYPVGGHDTSALPHSLVEHELTDLRCIARAKAQPRCRRYLAVPIGLPLK